MKNFEDLIINENIMQAIKALGFEMMTPIQEASLPIILEGKDIIAQAPTGTGKTICFAIPSIQMIDLENKSVQVMVLCPTRELAIQVTNEFKKVAQLSKGVKIITVYGGQSIDLQIRSLKNKPQIIVGTPGRIMDHMRRGTLNIDNIKMLVLDEADEMLNMGFKEDLDMILKDVKTVHQTLLFSATIPEGIKRLTKEYQKDAIFVRTTYNETAIPNIEQFYVEISDHNKVDCLSRMIDTYNFKQALVFCRTKKKVDELSLALTSRGYQVECLHGDLKQAGRDKVMEMFREGMIRVLIATDVAARGLDIEGIDAVFNYDITDDVEYYIHRIGRTARAGRSGAAYTFVSKREVSRLKQFIAETKTPIIKIAPPTYQMAEASKVRHTLKDLTDSMVGVNLKPYLDYITIALNEADVQFEPIEIAAAFLKKIIDNDSKYKDEGLDLELKEQKQKNKTPNNYVRLFINLGRKDEISKKTLIELLCTNHDINKNEIINIDIMNSFSFFEIPITKVEQVLKSLKNMFYNGRQIDVEAAVERGKKITRSKKKFTNSQEQNVKNQQKLSKQANISQIKVKKHQLESLKKPNRTTSNQKEVEKINHKINFDSRKKPKGTKPAKKRLDIQW